MKQPIIKPTGDLAFKKLFASEENREIIKHFIADILGIATTADQISIRNPYSIHSYLEQRNAVTATELAEGVDSVMTLRETQRDVTMAVLDVGDVTIEMQVLEPEHFIERAHYYLDDLYISNYNQNIPKNGSKYQSLKPAMSLNILGFNLFPDDDRALRTFTYHDKETLTPLETKPYKQMSFLELKKPNAAAIVSAWQEFIKTGLAQPDDPDYIKDAAKIISYQRLSPKEREVIDAATKREDTDIAVNLRIQRRIREESEQARAKGHAQGHAEGHAEGHDEGRLEEKIENSRNALAQGLAPEMVYRITGLPLADVIALQAEATPQDVW
jgi:predicted transposase/invertase (TIGR01784 family)